MISLPFPVRHFLAFAVLAVPAVAAPSPEAQIDNLRALSIYADGGKPEAMRWLARSLHVQQRDNPAASLAFQLLTNLRVQSNLRLRGHTGAITQAVYSKDGSRIATASVDHTARIWDAHTGAPLIPPLDHPDEVLGVDFSPDGKLVATAGKDGVARVWDVSTGHLVSATEPDREDVKFVRFSPDGKFLAGGTENFGYIWNARTGKPAFPPFAKRANVFDIEFNPGDSTFAVARGDDKAEIYDLKTGKVTGVVMPHEGRVFALKYNADGSRLLTACADGTARIWRTSNGEPMSPRLQHGGWVFSVDYSSSGNRVASGSSDHTARIWDVRTGAPVTIPLEHGRNVLRVTFSPDGSRLATTSAEGMVRVWDTESGEAAIFPINTAGNMVTATFSPDGRTLLFTDAGGNAQTVDLAPVEPPPAWLADLADFASAGVTYDSLHAADLAKITTLRSALLSSKSNDPWEAFGRWYFLEAAERGISPWSPVTLEKYVDSLIALGDRESIDYAISMSRDQPKWMQKLVPLQNKLQGEAAKPAAPAPHSDD